MANIINYNDKTNWKIDEIFKPEDANRIEKGVKDDNNGLKVLNTEVQALSDLIGSGGSAGSISKRVTDLETSTTELANSKLDNSTVTDNVTSTSTTSPLSANQGRLLNINVNSRVEKVAGKDLSSNDYTTTEKNKLSGLQNTSVTDSLTSTSTTNALSANQGRILNTNVNSRVEKVDGKGLSTHDYTTQDRNKLATLNNTTVVDNLTSTSSTSALSANQGNILDKKALKVLVRTNTVQLNVSEGTMSLSFNITPTSSSIKSKRYSHGKEAFTSFNFGFSSRYMDIHYLTLSHGAGKALFTCHMLTDTAIELNALIDSNFDGICPIGSLTLTIFYTDK